MKVYGEACPVCCGDLTFGNAFAVCDFCREVVGAAGQEIPAALIHVNGRTSATGHAQAAALKRHS